MNMQNYNRNNKFNLNKEKIVKIKLDKNQRLIKLFNKPIDATFVEILESDKINEDNFYILI